MYVVVVLLVPLFAYSFILASLSSFRVQVPGVNVRNVIVVVIFVGLPFNVVPEHICTCLVATYDAFVELIRQLTLHSTDTMVASAGMEDVSNLKYIQVSAPLPWVSVMLQFDVLSMSVVYALLTFDKEL